MTSLNPLRGFALAAVLGMTIAGPVQADDDWHGGARYEVTVTNLTRGQQFTPILVTTHKADVQLFQGGQPASAELSALAEEGNTAPLAAALAATPGVGDVVAGNGLTNPGATSTLTIHARRRIDRISLAAMLIPTNDAFVALNSLELPKGRSSVSVSVPAYDAGSERNDELCASIPGPFFAECGGPGSGGSPVGGEEGYVHIHAGIHGIGDLVAADRDWRNPVARITVRRLP